MAGSGFSSFPIIGPIVGGFTSGIGAVKANSEAKGNDVRLGWQLENAGQLLNPLRESLVSGLQPGGFIRTAMGVPGITKAFNQGEDARRAAGNAAYRFGGKQFGGSGGFLSRWRRAPAEAEQSRMEGDLQATDLLARVDAAMRGTDAAFPPVAPRNQLLGIGQAISQFGQGFGGGTY